MMGKNYDKYFDSLDLQKKFEELNKVIKDVQGFLPNQRKPTILICGKTGNGKTSTINTFFGEEVGKIGDFSRGTDKDEIYEWESSGENINVIDLPGLGDSDKNDEIFQEIYRQRIKDADAFIVVIAPPRPAEIGTLKTLQVLLESEVPSKNIIFGYNKLSDIRYKDKNGNRKQVNIKDGLTGLTPEDADIVKIAKEEFFKSLKAEFPQYPFAPVQIIEYDAETGWNLHKMFIAAIKVLPYETFFKLERILRDAEKQILEREIRKLTEETERLKKLAERIDRNQENVSQEIRNQVSDLQKELADKVKGIQRFVEEGKDVKLNMLEIIYLEVEAVLQSVNTTVATQVRRLREGLSSFGEAIQEGINNFTSSLQKSISDIGKPLELIRKAWENFSSWFA